MLSPKQAQRLVKGLEKYADRLGFTIEGTINEDGTGKRGQTVYNMYHTVVVADVNTGERVEVPAKVDSLAAFETWWTARR